MSNLTDLEVGDYIDFEGHACQVKIITAITPQGYQIKDPFSLHSDANIFPFARFKPFRSFTRLRQYSNPTLGIVRKIKTCSEQIPQLGQLLRQIMADPLSFNPKQLIQTLRGKHYFSLQGLLTTAIESEETYNMVMEYLSLHRQLFLKYLLAVDFSKFDSSNIYSNSMNALCSCYPEMIEMLDITCGTAPQFNEFRNKSEPYFKKELFEQQIHEWLESQFLVAFVETKHQSFPPQVLVLLIISVIKITKTFQIDISEPLADYFQTLYDHYLSKIQSTLPSSRDINILNKFTLNLFRNFYQAQQISAGSQLRNSKITDSSQTEKLESNEEVRVGSAKIEEELQSVPMNREQFVKQKEIELKYALAYSYLIHGQKDSCLREFNFCITQSLKECKIKQEVSHLPQNWPKTVLTFFQFLRTSDFLEKLLNINNFIASMISIRSSLISLFPFLPKEIALTCIKTGRANILKTIILQRSSIGEDVIIEILQQLLDYDVPEAHIKEINQLIKYLEKWLKDKKSPQADKWRCRLLHKQYELALSMKHLEINIFDTLSFVAGDDLKKENFNKIIQAYILPNLNILLEHFNEYLLFKYIQTNSISQSQFEQMLHPLFLKDKDLVIFERRKMSIIQALHYEFRTSQDKNKYFALLKIFIQYYSHQDYGEEQRCSDWKNYGVYFGNEENKKVFLNALTEQFCQELIIKILPLSSELDIKLMNDLFLKINFCQGKLTLDHDSSTLNKILQIPSYFRSSLLALYHLGKDEFKTHQKFIQIYFSRANEEVYYAMLEQFLKIIIQSKASSKEVNMLFKALKSKSFQLPLRSDTLPADITLTFFNKTLEQQFDQIVNRYEPDPYRKFLANEEKSINYVFELKNGQTLNSIKIKLAHRINLEPVEIALIQKQGNILPGEVEHRTIGNSAYLFADQAVIRSYRIQGKTPKITIQFRILPEKSPVHQSLLLHAVQLFELLPKSYPLLSGIDMRIQNWGDFDKSNRIAETFRDYVRQGKIPEQFSKSICSITLMLNFFLWHQQVEKIKTYDFCFLLPFLKIIENLDDALLNFKIIYLIYLSENFSVEFREELLSGLLLTVSSDLLADEEDQTYTYLSELVYGILKKHPEGALEFCFTNQFIVKCAENEVSYASFKEYWTRVFEDASLKQKGEILNNVEDRFNNFLPNMKELGSLIEETINTELICFYETTLERMARYVVDLHRTKVTSQEHKISCELLRNCWEFVRKNIQCDQLFSKQFVLFLTNHFYDYAFHIVEALFDLIAHCMKNKFNRQHLLSFIHQEMSEEEWKKRDWLEGGKKYREPQPSGYVGLINCFNTCYANSLFQQFFHNEFFCRELLSADWQPKDKPKEDLLLQFKKIFLHLKEDQHPYENRDFFQLAFKLPDGYPVETTIQMDVDQFRNLLFNHLQEILPKNMFWSRIYEGKQDSNIKCLQCGNISTTQESFNSICLSVQDLEDLQSSLEDHHKPLILENENAYSCQKCSKKVRAEKSLAIKSLPPHLIFVLKRFQYVAERGYRRKLNNHFEFPLDQLVLEGGETYNLKGIISHIGYSDSGHYISYLKIKDQWFEFNDSRVKQLSEEQVKLNSYGSLRGADKESVTQRTAYLLFYENADHPSLQNSMQIEERYVGVEVEMQKILKEKRLFNKEIAFLNCHFIHFLDDISSQYPSIQTLEILFEGLIEIGLKIRLPEGKQLEIYQKELLRSFEILSCHHNKLPFVWNYLDQILKIIQSTALIEYKTILVHLLASNLPQDVELFKSFIDFCLSNIYQTKMDVSPLFVFLHEVAIQSHQAAQYMHEHRIIGRILDSTFAGLVLEPTRKNLKQSTPIPFEKTIKVFPSELKEELRYHKWALLLFFVQKNIENLHKSEDEYLSMLLKSLYLQRVFEETRTKPTIYFVGKLFSFLCQHFEMEFTNKLLQIIRDGIKKEKGDLLRRYLVVLEAVLAIEDGHQQTRNQQAVIILSIILSDHNLANDFSFELLWLWMLKIANRNECLRKEMAMKRSNFEFLFFKSYPNTSFYRAEKSNSLPIRTRHRLYGLPVPLTSKECQPYHTKKIENTKAIFNRSQHSSFFSEPVNDEPTVVKSVYANSKVFRLSDITQQFEEFEVQWVLGDIVALKKPMIKEKFPLSYLLLKGDERVVVRDEPILSEESEIKEVIDVLDDEVEKEVNKIE